MREYGLIELNRKPLDAVAIRIAVDLGVFKILVDTKKPKTTGELAQTIAIDEAILGRILRYLVATDAIANVGPKGYVATKVSRAFTTKKGTSASNLLSVSAT